MAKISQNVLEDIKARLSIVDLVSRYLSLNRKGDRYWGLCPFHEEKTPSFSVLPDKGFFHCFGCGKSGSLFDFYMEMEHLTFPESVRALAESLGIQIEEENPQEKRKRNEREVLSETLHKTRLKLPLYPHRRSSGGECREYLRERGIDNQTVDHFQIGYAPSDPSWLYSFLSKKNYSDTLLKNSGLFSRNGSFFPLSGIGSYFRSDHGRGKLSPSGKRYQRDEQSQVYQRHPRFLSSGNGKLCTVCMKRSQ